MGEMDLGPEKEINSIRRKIEEETLPFYKPSNFYPAYIGQVLASKYRVVGKLGFGASSTVWLAWDLRFGHHSLNLKDSQLTTSSSKSLHEAPVQPWTTR